MLPAAAGSEADRWGKPGAICAVYGSVLNEVRLEPGSRLASLLSCEVRTYFQR